ncbi:hypothetical protein D3C71_2205440 [compost metagenome]
MRGTSGHRKMGRVSGSSPMSPTVRISMSMVMATAVRMTMHSSGEGTSLPTTGISGNR